MRILPLILCLLVSAPAFAAEGGGGFTKLDNLVIEMWDKNGIFHTLVLQMQATFPERPQMPKGMGDKVKHTIQTIPYEELKKPDGAERIKDIVKDVLRDDPGSAKVEDIFITKMFFQ